MSCKIINERYENSNKYSYDRLNIFTINYHTITRREGLRRKLLHTHRPLVGPPVRMWYL